MEVLDLLINGGTVDFVKSNRYPYSKDATFVFPVNVYKIDFVTAEEDGNAIKVAIKRLLDYYKNNPSERRKYEYNVDGHRVGDEKSDVAMIAQDLGLKEKLVEYVIEQEKLKATRHLISSDDNDSENDNDTCENKEHKTFYAVYDGLTQQLIGIVSDATFAAMKVDPDDVDEINNGREYRYRPSKGSSESENLIVVGRDCNIRMQAPTKEAVEKLIKGKYHYKKPFGELKIIHDGQYELAVTCYYSKIDVNQFVPAPPLSYNMGAREMKSIISRLIKDKTCAGKKIESVMNGKRAKTGANNSCVNKEIRESLKKQLQDAYPEFKKDEYKGLLDRYINLYVAYAWVFQIKNSSGDYGMSSIKENMAEVFALQDYRIAVFTFLEEVFTWSFNHSNLDSSDKAYEFLLNRLSAQEETNEEIIKELAEAIGFVGSDLSGINVNIDSVKYLFENTNYKENKWTTVLCGLLVQAFVDNSHPLRKVAEECCHFLSIVEKAHKKRNRAKHGNLYYDYDTAEYDDLYFKAIDAFNLLVTAPSKEKIPQPGELKNFYDVQERFNSAYVDAISCLEKENIDKSNEDAYAQLLCESVSNNYKDSEYATKLSNLHDELLFQLIRELGCNDYCDVGLEERYSQTEDERKREGTKRAHTVALDKAKDLLKKQKVDYCEKYFDPSKFGRILKEWQKEKSIKMLSTRNKLLYYILSLNEYKLYADEDWQDEKFGQMLATLIEDVNETLGYRKHNEISDWAEKETNYKRLHKSALEIYKYFTNKINQYRERRKNG